MDDIEQWARTIVAITAALGALGYIARKIYRKVIKPVLDNIDAAASIIHKQLNPNNGHSLLDHVNQIPDVVDRLHKLTARVEKIEMMVATPKEIDE